MMRAACLTAFACVSALSGCMAASTESTDRFAATGELIALSGAEAGAGNACIGCHGTKGEGDGGFTPRLAGLDAGYLERQMIAYADGRREHAQMGYIARKLAPAERRAVSAHYAAMPFAPEPAVARVGTDIARLYDRGDRARGLASCASCHGARGEGVGAANPALAGQPAGYLAAQLDHWRHSRRRNDPGDVMLAIAQRLTPAESAALAAYGSALPGGPPSREYPAASRAGHRDDPRNGASGPPLHVPESARAAE